jgi:hypothetical protein
LTTRKDEICSAVEEVLQASRINQIEISKKVDDANVHTASVDHGMSLWFHALKWW